MATRSVFIVGIVFIGLYLNLLSPVEAAGLRCAPCPNGECPEPENCAHGIVNDYCGRQVCAKGPAESCGTGRLAAMIGECGDGMFCKCGRCLGCSLATMECYHKTCV